MKGRNSRTAPRHGGGSDPVFGEFRESLYRYLLHKLHHAQSAEDLTQEVYLRLLRTADRNMVRNPQAYVFGVAFNVLYEFRLHERRTPVVYDSQVLADAAGQVADDSPSPQELSEKRSMEHLVDGIVSQLSPMQQVVLLMAKRQELSHAEIAQRLGISIATVRKHLARAIDQFRKHFDG